MTDAEREAYRLKIGDDQKKWAWLGAIPEPWCTFLIVTVMLLLFPIWLPICFCTAMYMTIRGFFVKDE